MSAYHPPDHNRLFDLEQQLHRQRPQPLSSRRSPGKQSIQKRQSSQQSVQGWPMARRQRQLGYPPQITSHQQIADVDEPSSPSNARPQRPQVGFSSSFAVSNSDVPTPQPTRHRQSSGAYRQLAAHMGKPYYSNTSATTHKPVTRLPQNDLPVIPTPTNLEMVEIFAEQHPPKIARSKKRAIAPPDPQPEHPISSPLPSPSWKGLAQSIRRARLGLTEPDTEATTLDAPKHNPQQWAIDTIFTEVDEPTTPEVPESGCLDVEDTIDFELEALELEALESEDLHAEETIEAFEPENLHENPIEDNDSGTVDSEKLDADEPPVSPESAPIAFDLSLETLEEKDINNQPGTVMPTEAAAALPVTSDVIPAAQTKDISETGIHNCVLSTDSITERSAIIPVAEQQAAESFTATHANTDTGGLKHGLLLLTYQLAYPPQIVRYLTQLQSKQKRNQQRQKHKRKRPPFLASGKQKTRTSHPTAS